VWSVAAAGGEVVAKAGLPVAIVLGENAKGAWAAARALDEAVVGECGGVGTVVGGEVLAEGGAVGVRAGAAEGARDSDRCVFTNADTDRTG
jgi:hypothetical protein